MLHRDLLFKNLLALLLIITINRALGCGRREQRKPDPASRRMTRSGAVVGFQEERYGGHAWLGIPFAKPPVGPLRWRAPQRPEQWIGTREALAFGSACTQVGGLTGKGAPVGSEDCLYLNVYAPRFTEAQAPKAGARLPVMLWIYGGGNFTGDAGQYTGGNLAATHKLIVITTNYRVGPFGWFRHAALRADGADDLDRSGNFGTLDLLRALQWIRENADPGDTIALWGRSIQNLLFFKSPLR